MEGPPAVSARTETAMKWGPAPVMSTCPAPSRPARFACRAVTTPPITRAAKTAHDRYPSSKSTAVKATVTNKTVFARAIKTP